MKALLCLAVMVIAGGTPTPSADDDLLTLRGLDQRVAEAGYSLARAASPFCPERVPLPGFVVHGIEQYGASSRDAARRTFGLGDELAVLLVVHDSPAEAAGLRARDALLAVDDQPLPPVNRDATARVETVNRIIEQGKGATLTFDVARAGMRRTVTFTADRGCATHFWVDPSPRPVAEADGHEVVITAGYVERAAGDAALAIVLAHELAHNILHHRARLDRDGAHHGLGRYFGRSAGLSRAAELEADQLSIAIIGCAGYSLDDAVAFRETLWRDGLADALFRAPDHPGARQRLDAIRAAIATYRADPVPCAAKPG